MRVLKAGANWREGLGADPQLRILVDKRPANELRYERRGNIYFAEKDGYGNFCAWSGEGNDRGMCGGEVPITMKDGREVVLKGPWSSNPVEVEQAGFEPTMDVAITDDAEAYKSGSPFFRGNATLNLAREIATELDGVKIEKDPMGHYIPVRS